MFPNADYQGRNHPNPSEGELDPGGSKTETAGFMTNKQKIDRLLAGGVINANFREAHFPPNEDVPDEMYPPEQYPDEIDAITAARKMVAGQTARKAREEAEAEREAKEQEQQLLNAADETKNQVTQPDKSDDKK